MDVLVRCYPRHLCSGFAVQLKRVDIYADRVKWGGGGGFFWLFFFFVAP